MGGIIQTAIPGPQTISRKARCDQYLNISPADPPSVKPVGFNKLHTLVCRADLNLWQKTQGSQSFGPVQEIPRRKFPQNHGMDCNKTLLEDLCKTRESVAEVVNPNGSICENHFAWDFSDRVRFGISNKGICPPSAASLRDASRSTSASKPILTSAVFSVSPVYSPARASNDPSMLSVVLICINMHDSDALRQFSTRENRLSGQIPPP